MRLPPDLLRDLKRISPVRAWGALLVDWGTIGLSLWLCVAFPNPLVWLPAMLITARAQHALAVMMHDAAHCRWLASPRWNDILGQIFFASPLFFSLDGYRWLHFAHHRAPLTPDDPDLPLNGGYPITEASFRRKLLRDITGRTYLKAFRYFTFIPERRLRSPLWVLRHPFLVGGILNLALLAILTAVGQPGVFLFVWLLPQVTLLQVILRIRGVAEHSGLSPGRDQRAATRTMLPSWQTWLLAPHCVHYHIEHHLLPTVPFYHLPRLHQAYRERQVFLPGTISPSYSALYRELVMRRSE